jgi:hypothetical protein
LDDAGWSKAKFVIEKMINGVKKESQSHEVDHVRSFEQGVVALEDRIRRGVGNPCPLVLIGLPAGIVRFEDAEQGRS